VADDDVCTVTCDGSFTMQDGSAGLGITISWRGKEAVIGVPRRGISAPHTELMAVERGLREALKRGATKVLVRSDSKWSMEVLNWVTYASKPHILKILNPIWALEEQFAECTYEWIPREQNRQSDLASKKARRMAQEREAARRAEKAALVAKALVRAANVQVGQKGGRWFVWEGGGIVLEVDLPNMTCGCYWYTERWANVNLAGRRKNMIPCKHMAAVAQATGVTFA
jgi:ribonuclease HI